MKLSPTFRAKITTERIPHDLLSDDAQFSSTIKFRYNEQENSITCRHVTRQGSIDTAWSMLYKILENIRRLT